MSAAQVRAEGWAHMRRRGGGAGGSPASLACARLVGPPARPLPCARPRPPPAAARCRLTLRILEATVSGEHKFKVAGAIVSEEAAASGGTAYAELATDMLGMGAESYGEGGAAEFVGTGDQ